MAEVVDERLTRQRRNRPVNYEQSPGKSGNFHSPKRESRSPRVKQLIASGFTVFTNKRNHERNGNNHESPNVPKFKKEVPQNHGQSKRHSHNSHTNPQVGQPAFKETSAPSAEVDELNEAALRRLDPAFKQLFGTSSQVAIYDFDTVTKNWKQSDCAGCFFLYARNTAPRYGFVVMNRLNLDNFKQTFDLDTEVQSLPPYILLKNKSAISCLWFYSPEECSRFSVIMDTKMGLTFTAEDGTPLHKSSLKTNDVPMSASGISYPQSLNAMSLLGSGQGLLNMLVSGLKLEKSNLDNGGGFAVPQQPIVPTEQKRKSVLTVMELEQELIGRAPAVAPQPVASPKNEFEGSYLDLRLFAGGASAPYRDGYLGQNVAIQNPSGFVPVQTNTVSSHFNDIFSQLQVSYTNAAGPHDVAIAGRMQTVEQLERDMRSQETQDEDAKELEEDLRRKLGIGNISRAGSDSSNGNVGFSKEGSRKPSVANSIMSSPRGSNELSAKSPFLTPMTPQSRSSDSRRSDREMTADDLVGLPLSESDIEVVREVFQNGNGRDLCLIPIDTPERKQSLHWAKTRQAMVNSQMSSIPQNHQYHIQDFSISPLTKEQLQQGFIHLLTTDPTFVVKLHEAYVASLNSSLRKD